jgi:hypothetical protein
MSKELLAELANNESFLSATELNAARQVAARLNLARGLRRLEIDSLGQTSAEAYFALLKLSLAYSAADAMKTLDAGWQVVVVDHEMQRALSRGMFEDLLMHLRASADRQQKPNTKELVAFGLGQPNLSLLTFVKHCRNVVFHASATPRTIGLASSKNRRELILGLANSTLLAVEKTLNSWLKAKSAN